MSDQREFEAQIKFVFCSTNPSLTRFPHCIFYNYDNPVRIIADIVKVPVGVWGDYFFVDANGEPYVSPWDGRIIDEFALWTLPVNQERALDYTGRQSFSMVISADTSLDVLEKVYDLADANDQEFHYETFITKIARLIPELGWAYIPLAYENDYALFVTSINNAHYVEEFKRRLAEAGNTKVFDISATETGQRWNGPILWEL